MKATPVEMVPVESSMLSAVGYDAEATELVAKFQSGAVWRYRKVPKEIYDGLLKASSKGSYMRMHVLDVYADYRVKR